MHKFAADGNGRAIRINSIAVAVVCDATAVAAAAELPDDALTSAAACAAILVIINTLSLPSLWEP